MTKKEFERIGKALIPLLPGFQARGPLLFISPVGNVLRAFYFDGSIDPRRFFVHVLLQPLFVPSEHLGLTLGWRIGGGSHRWDADAANLVPSLGAALMQEGTTFLTTVKSPLALVAAIQALGKPEDPYVRQAIAFSYVRAGKVAEACRGIDELLAVLNGTTGWQREMAERARDLRSQLLNDLDGAAARLDAWEAETTKNLGLEDVRQ